MQTNAPFHPKRSFHLLQLGLSIALGIGSVFMGSAWAKTPGAVSAVPVATQQVVAPKGAVVASGHQLATNAGIQMLRMGGNAFDAAVAVSSTLSVVEPISSGIGGGGFFLLHDARTGKDVFLDARETSPESATPEQFLDAQGNLDINKSQNGPWSAGIPGLPAALVHLAERHGRLPLNVSLAPAIHIARQGFPLYARMVKGYEERKDVMDRFPASKALMWQDGDAPEVGELFKQPDLARTLERLAAGGYDGFYKGETAQLLLKAVADEGGRWTPQELGSYAVKFREPLRFNYRNWSVTTAPPPSSGGIAMQEILQTIDGGWNLNAMSRVEQVHLLTEAMRRAYRDRTIYLGDPDFVKVPMARLQSKEYAAGLRATIHPQKATPSDLLIGQPAPLEDDETTHFSIIDSEGNRVAATQTVNLLYGSGMVAPGTGVLLNDEMDDFALKPGTPNAFGVMGFEANAPKPGKRMLSSMSPTFIESPTDVVALGAPGGSRIITEVLLGIIGYDQGLSSQQVAALPRFHHQWLPDTIYAEHNTFSPQEIADLEKMGHKVTVQKTWGNLQTVRYRKTDGTVDGGTDPRNPVGSVQTLRRAVIKVAR